MKKRPQSGMGKQLKTTFIVAGVQILRWADKKPSAGKTVKGICSTVYILKFILSVVL